MSESMFGPLLRDNFKLNTPILEYQFTEFIVIKISDNNWFQWRTVEKNDQALGQDDRERLSTHSNFNTGKFCGESVA